MPALITLVLELDSGEPVPTNPQRALQAIFYDWLRMADPDLASAIHDQAHGPKPYTLSGLIPATDEACHWHLALLDDHLTPALLSAIEATQRLSFPGGQLRIDHGRTHIVEKGYDELLTSARPDTLIHLRFLSPTSFRSGGLVYLFPEPFKCWQSWLSRWNTFAPSADQINVVVLDAVQVHVAVSRYSLSTQTLQFKAEHRSQIGFVGRTSFAIVGSNRLPEAVLRQINALADYARFCGTGHATTRGLGQTARDARE